MLRHINASISLPVYGFIKGRAIFSGRTLLALGRSPRLLSGCFSSDIFRFYKSSRKGREGNIYIKPGTDYVFIVLRADCQASANKLWFVPCLKRDYSVWFICRNKRNAIKPRRNTPAASTNQRIVRCQEISKCLSFAASPDNSWEPLT